MKSIEAYATLIENYEECFDSVDEVRKSVEKAVTLLNRLRDCVEDLIDGRDVLGATQAVLNDFETVLEQSHETCSEIADGRQEQQRLRDRVDELEKDRIREEVRQYLAAT